MPHPLELQHIGTPRRRFVYRLPSSGRAVADRPLRLPRFRSFPPMPLWLRTAQGHGFFPISVRSGRAGLAPPASYAFGFFPGSISFWLFRPIAQVLLPPYFWFFSGTIRARQRLASGADFTIQRASMRRTDVLKAQLILSGHFSQISLINWVWETCPRQQGKYTHHL